jgi:hypothetical protein
MTEPDLTNEWVLAENACVGDYEGWEFQGIARMESEDGAVLWVAGIEPPDGLGCDACGAPAPAIVGEGRSPVEALIDLRASMAEALLVD